MCSHATMCSRLQKSLHPSATLLAMLSGNLDRGSAHVTVQSAEAPRALRAARTPVPAAPPAHVCTLFGLQPPCDYFGAQTQRSPCVMYPSYPPTWWCCQISALASAQRPCSLGHLLPCGVKHIHEKALLVPVHITVCSTLQPCF
jgi:hypothetical protein